MTISNVQFDSATITFSSICTAIASSNTGHQPYCYRADDMGGAQAEIYWKSRHNLSARIPTKLVHALNGQGLELWSIHMNASGFLELRDAGNLVVQTGAQVMPLNQNIRLEGHAKIHATTLASNILELKSFLTDENAPTPTETLTQNGKNMGPQGGTHRFINHGLGNPSASGSRVNTITDVASSTSGYIGSGTSGTDIWSGIPVDPFGAGGMNDFEWDPNVPNRGYMTTDVGGLRATDDGKQFYPLMRINGSDGARKSMSVMVGNNAGTTMVGVCAGANPSVYYESLDGGVTFHARTESWPNFNGQKMSSGDQTLGDLPGEPRHNGSGCFDPGSPVYRYFTTFKQGIYRASDSLGTTATRIGQAPPGANFYFGSKCYVDPNTSGSSTDLLVAVRGGGGAGKPLAGLYRVAGVRSGSSPTITRLSPPGLPVEEIAFGFNNTMYAVCGDFGVYRVPASGGYTSWFDETSTKVTPNAYWTTVTCQIVSGKDMVAIGCFNPYTVNSAGTPTASTGLYGLIYRNDDAANGTTWNYICNPNNVNFNDFTDGKRFWNADRNQKAMPGKQNSTCQALRWDPNNNQVLVFCGSGGIFWRSEDRGANWRACAKGVVIGSSMGMFKDRFRAGWAWGTNQDLDAFYTNDYGVNFQQTPDVSGYSVGYGMYSDQRGFVYLCMGSDPQGGVASGGVLMRWNGSGGAPTWTTIGGNPKDGGSTTVNSLPDKRNLGVISFQLADHSWREMVYQDTGKLWYRDGGAGAWAEITNQLPAHSPSLNPVKIICPNNDVEGTLYLFLQTAGDGGVYRSLNYGMTWVKIITSNNNNGEVFAADGQSHTIYFTDGGKLGRLRNAHFMTLDQSDVIAGLDRVNSTDRCVRGDFDQATGNMLIACGPSDPTDTRMLRITAPETSGNFTQIADLADPIAGRAADRSIQRATWDVNGVVFHGNVAYVSNSGGSYLRMASV